MHQRPAAIVQLFNHRPQFAKPEQENDANPSQELALKAIPSADVNRFYPSDTCPWIVGTNEMYVKQITTDRSQFSLQRSH